jgi:hypothetical protein
MPAKPKPTKPAATAPSSPSVAVAATSPQTPPAKPVPELPDSWNLKTVCGTCHQAKNVLLVHRTKLADRIVEWSICISCQIRENRLAS